VSACWAAASRGRRVAGLRRCRGSSWPPIRRRPLAGRQRSCAARSRCWRGSACHTSWHASARALLRVECTTFSSSLRPSGRRLTPPPGAGAGSRSPPFGRTRGTQRGGWHTFTGGHWCTATSRQGMWLSAGTATPDTWTWVRVACAASSGASLMASSRSCTVGGGAGGERVVGEDRVGGGAHDGEAERCERIGVERGSVGERVGRRRRR